MCGCVSGKPEEVATPNETVSPAEAKPSHVSAEKPWNRQSAHVYCGERKKSADVDPNKSPKLNENNTHPGGTELIGQQEDKVEEEDKKVETDANSNTEIVNHKEDIAANPVTPITDSSNKSLPSIVEESGDTPISGRLNPPPLIAPFNPSAYKVIRRPRSLDAWESKQSVSRSRPLSYSPGLKKTKHPRSLHSINQALTSSVPLKDRPKSVDIESLYESRGFDSLKIKRILAQKHKKSHEEHTPNHICHVEEGPSRYFQPSQIMARKKKNKDLKIKEVEYFRRALLRPRMKFSESLKIFMQRLEQYLEFDPLLDNTNTLSNPWISDDETIWDINRDNIEIPTVMRIRKWGLNFEELLQDSRGWSEFEMFLKKEYSQENILFYEACKKLVSCPIKEVLNRKQKIEKEYLTAGAQGEVNIDCKTLEVVINNLKTENSQNNRYVFQPAMDHVYALMKKDSYSRFLRSDQYKDLLQNAQSNYSKKRFLGFGSNRKKNTVTASPQPRRRGSTSSDNALGGEGDISGSSYHSYSTGNLRELDEKPKKSIRQSNSPSIRRKVDETDKNANKEKDVRRRSNLDVPRSSGYSSGSNETNRKSEAMSQCLALNVPKSNVVAPWEGE